MARKLLSIVVGGCVAAVTCAGAATNVQVLQAEDAKFDPARMEVVDRPSFPGGKGVMIRRGAGISDPAGKPDLTFEVTISKAGRYRITSFADATGAAREAMRKAKDKFDHLAVMIAVDDDFPRRRVLFEPWGNPAGYYEKLMKCDFSRGRHVIRLWLPADSALDRLNVEPYLPPPVPGAARRYVPKLVPPASHPRLWCNAETLPEVRANLTKGENREVWEAVRKEAAAKYPFKPVPPRTATEYDIRLQAAAVNKAFVHLMTGDRELGEEAVRLMRSHLGTVEFGNILDITRELGATIYNGAQVYDWCYDLLTPEDRAFFRKNLMRLADDMEIGWPPFGQIIVNGHGDEGQVNRDLLSMAIALYGDYDLPYQYCSYRILEELVPMRNFSYRCGRHDQGSLYGHVRYSNELLGALMLYRMSGRRVFDDSFARLFYHFIYAQTPTNSIIPDGDCHWTYGQVWRPPIFSFLSYAYSGDPVLGSFFRWTGGPRGIRSFDRLIFLMTNDPDRRIDADFRTLPLTRYFNGAIPSMMARTGWNLSKDSADVFVDMKGGGRHFGNHQHADAGGFQIFYKGWLATNIGQYHSYGMPYDFGYNKRSISHNVMLAYQPGEKFLGGVNDGGQRFIQTMPSLRMVLRDPEFKIGETVAADFGPDAERPLYTYFKTDIAAAYRADKVKEYTRTFCFLNLDGTADRAALITVDRMKTARPSYRKYWLINSMTAPEITGNTAVITSAGGGRLKVRMLLPRKVKTESVGDGAVSSFFGVTLPQPPAKASEPIAKAWRTMFTPEEEKDEDLFVAVMQIGDADVEPPPAEMTENAENCQITIANRAAVLGVSGSPARTPFKVRLPKDRGDVQLLLADLMPGVWNVRGTDGGINVNVPVAGDKTTAFLVLPGGEYQVSPGAVRSAADYVPPHVTPGDSARPDGGDKR